MIRWLENYGGEDLRDSHYSAVIRSHLLTYGTKYDFCRFYELCGKKRIGIISVFNGAVTVDLVEGAKLTRETKREIAEFVDFQSPYSVELPNALIPRGGFVGYQASQRAFFEVTASGSAEGIIAPEPENVFKTVFGESGDYGLWLTDTMRRVNSGFSRLYGYNSSVLTVRFMIGGRAYITDVATPLEDRGKGYARTLLGGVSRIFWDAGISCYLSAEAGTAGYYRALGYREFAADRIFINKNNGESK